MIEVVAVTNPFELEQELQPLVDDLVSEGYDAYFKLEKAFVDFDAIFRIAEDGAAALKALELIRAGLTRLRDKHEDQPRQTAVIYLPNGETHEFEF
ncbi:MAG: hypothetical protein EPN45_06255 [Rhizobiaceae bacterium]|nr:MAG: hypothetical protein EPN45_06255 [Rhizobiaceae bacterium]